MYQSHSDLFIGGDNIVQKASQQTALLYDVYRYAISQDYPAGGVVNRFREYSASPALTAASMDLTEALSIAKALCLEIKGPLGEPPKYLLELTLLADCIELSYGWVGSTYHRSRLWRPTDVSTLTSSIMAILARVNNCSLGKGYQLSLAELQAACRQVQSQLSAMQLHSGLAASSRQGIVMVRVGPEHKPFYWATTTKDVHGVRLDYYAWQTEQGCNWVRSARLVPEWRPERLDYCPYNHQHGQASKPVLPWLVTHDILTYLTVEE
jgi:hypothetical protein